MNLICPDCGQPLQKNGEYCRCPDCKEDYPVVNGIPLLFNRKQRDQYRTSKGTPQQYYRDVAEVYDRTHHVALAGAQHFLRDFEKKIEQHVAPQMDVLEIGAGTGFVSNTLRQMAKSLVVTDASLEMLSINTARNPALNAFCCATEQLPFPDGSFDRVIGNNTFYLVPDKREAARNIARVLKKGGKLILSEMNPHQPLWPIMFAIKGRLFERTIYKIFPFQMRSLFEPFGMKIEEVDFYSCAPYFAGKALVAAGKKVQGIIGGSRTLRRFSAIRIFYVIRKI